MKGFKVLYIPVALLFLTAIVMIGFVDYITADFDWTIIQSSSFWITNITSITGSIAVIIGVLLLRNQHYIENNEEYKYCDSEINKFYKMEYKAPIFNKFCSEDNLLTKREHYLKKVNDKRAKLKPKAKDLEIYFAKPKAVDPEERKKEEAEIAYAKAHNKYCKKLDYYDKITSEEYLANNISKMNLSYPKISPGLIFSGTEVNSHMVTNYVTTHKASKIAKDILPRFLLTTGLLVISSSFIPGIQDGITIAMIFKSAVKLFSIGSQIYFAYNYSNSYAVSVLLHDIQFRLDKISTFRLWYQNRISRVKSKEIQPDPMADTIEGGILNGK